MSTHSFEPNFFQLCHAPGTNAHTWCVDQRSTALAISWHRHFSKGQQEQAFSFVALRHLCLIGWRGSSSTSVPLTENSWLEKKRRFQSFSRAVSLLPSPKSRCLTFIFPKFSIKERIFTLSEIFRSYLRVSFEETSKKIWRKEKDAQAMKPCRKSETNNYSRLLVIREVWS